MKKIVLKLYEFDELSKDSQERIIEREHWNVMEQCMDAYGIDYKKSMKAFEDMTDTRVYNWEVGYERYDFSYEFKYKDPIYEHPDYHGNKYDAEYFQRFTQTAEQCRSANKPRIVMLDEEEPPYSVNPTYIRNLQEMSAEAVERLTELKCYSREEAFDIIQDWAKEFTKRYNNYVFDGSYYKMIDTFIEEKLRTI